jgi:peroxiredoxin
MKKIFVLSLSLLIVLFAQAQNGSYTLKGNILGSNADKVYLKYHTYGTYENHGRGEEIIDSTIVVNGKFTLCGKVNEPAYAEIAGNDNSFGCQFWLENSLIVMNGISGKAAEMTGSATQDLMDKESVALAPLKEAYNLKNTEYKKAKGNLDATNAKRLKAEMDDISGSQFHQLSERLVQENPDNYYSLNVVWNLAAMEKYNYEDLSRVFGYLSDNLKQTNLGKMVSSALAILKKTSKGESFPEYSQPDLEGNMVNVSDFRGKYLLLSFTSVGIEKDLGQVTIKQKLYEKYHAAGLEMMDVMFDNAKDKDKVKGYVNDNHLEWKIVSDFKSWDNSAVRDFSIEKIPSNFLIGPDGIIIASRVEPNQLMKIIEGAINK